MAPRSGTWNPLAFHPWPVTTWITIILAALFASLITTHNVVPKAPKNPTPYAGINTTQAWLDLQFLTNGFHPYNSRRNNAVRTWLLSRIEEILGKNNVTVTGSGDLSGSSTLDAAKKSSDVHIYNDLNSSLVFGSPGSPLTVAYTGENIIVYIRGSEDEEGRWWEDASTDAGHKSGVLINAHYDSVPSGYGATDDGVGVVSILQIISYFTAPANQPKRGVVALLNNGEEDYLNGAYAFTQHPISKFPHTFLNLEGAGAGGRAVLFRSTDAEVTEAYKKSPYPFGSVISADGFKRKLVRSDTDYSVFAPELGMRGLDIAFFEPRARYHTVEDSTIFTSKDSLWHMLSAAIATMNSLTSDTSDRFNGSPAVAGGVHAGKGHDSVWFDLFGRTFAVIRLHTVFAISVTLLVVTPLILIALEVILVKVDKWYLFSRKKQLEDSEVVQIKGLRGFFRYPIAFVVSTAAVVGLALLIAKLNPYIVYSSEYSVWSMMLTAWFVITWFLLRGASFVRPTALQRHYTLFWLYIGGFVVLAGDTVLENNFDIAGGYFMIIYFGGIFLALMIAYFELFALPRKTVYAEKLLSNDWDGAPSISSRPVTHDGERSSRRPSNDAVRQSEDDDANERTSLLRGDRHGTFASGYGGTRGRSSDEVSVDGDTLPPGFPPPYPNEQLWSGYFPRCTWFLQLLILTVVPLVLAGQVALLMTSSLDQTSSDGSSVLTIYLFMAVLSMLIIAPISPFIHRFSFPLPTLLLLICIGTAIYNLTAFPFSMQSRLKVYFVQQVNLDTGINTVSLTGLEPYVKTIITSLPSSAGEKVQCESPDYAARAGLTKCSWPGISPNPLNMATGIPPEKTYKSWITSTAKKVKNATDPHTAKITVDARNTRACRILFDRPVTNINVTGYGTDPRFPRVSNGIGSTSLRLWRREWDASPWEVFVTWDPAKEQNGKDGKKVGDGLDGKVVCLWSDANEPDTIPAWEEVRRYMPVWSTATKLSDGLVEGSKVFKV